jgi:hypothetical protein
MSKELKMLELIDIYITLDDYDRETSGVAEAIRLVKKALTPPTANDVCKALSEWFNKDVPNCYQTDFYYFEKEKAFYLDNINFIVYYRENTLRFNTNFPLPPHLITLIGKFYEGEVKGE